MTTPPAALIVFEDGSGDLGPLTDLRPSCLIRTGADATLERIARTFQIPLHGVRVPTDIETLCFETLDTPIIDSFDGDDALLVNGRCVVPDPKWAALPKGHAITEPETGDFIAARLCHKGIATVLKSGDLPEGATTKNSGKPILLRHPWDVVRHRNAAIAIDLALCTDQRPLGLHCEVAGDNPVSIDPTTTIARSVVLDASNGPIRIGANATIRHGAIVLGPASIGDGTTILEHALIKPNTAIGPHCKIAGELDGVIVQGHTNKAHDGHIGDSWLGSWINLGAGTTNSNLLNTYGEVTAQAQPNTRRVRTGMTFLGSILGDHVKTSIGTQLMTGAVVGTGSMLATTAPPPTCVDRFEWITDAGRSRFKLDKFMQTAEAMMARRDVKVTESMAARFAALHAIGEDK